jgi:galactonate dehydratase
MTAAQAAAATRSTGSDLEITEMRIFPVREPTSGRTYAVVRVRTRGGLTGYGEGAGIAEDAFTRTRQFWSGKPATAYATGDRRLPGSGAVDMALLDIVGKASKAPVYRVLGGPTRNKARAFASVPAAAVEQAIAAGYRAVGVALPAPAARNQGQAYQHEVRRVFDELRSRRSPGIDFVAEASEALTPGDAASVAATLERLHPLWLDEPCAVSNLQALRKICDESVVPVGFGRGLEDPSTYQNLLRDGLIDVVRPDIGHYGITAIRRLAALAEPYYTAVAPRHHGGPIATAAALHLAASLPNFFIQQIPFPAAAEDREMRAAIAGANLERVKDGFAELPGGPGLGITVNESALEKYHAA